MERPRALSAVDPSYTAYALLARAGWRDRQGPHDRPRRRPTRGRADRPPVDQERDRRGGRATVTRAQTTRTSIPISTTAPTGYRGSHAKLATTFRPAIATPVQMAQLRPLRMKSPTATCAMPSSRWIQPQAVASKA